MPNTQIWVAGPSMGLPQANPVDSNQLSDHHYSQLGASPTQPRILQHGVISLANREIVMLGSEHRILTCIEEPVTDVLGGYTGVTLYPLDEAMCGRELFIDSAARLYEARAGLTIPKDEVLVVRRLPRARICTPDAWTASAESAMAALIGNWGRATPQDYAKRYQIEYFCCPAPAVERFPDVDEMIELNLGRYIIDCYEHPGLDLLRERPTDEEYLSASFKISSVTNGEGLVL